MRVYPSVLAGGGVARWLSVAPRTERASTMLVLAGAGVVLSAACWGLALVPNLVLAPRTFLVLFTVAWLAYGGGGPRPSPLAGPGPSGGVPAGGVLWRLVFLSPLSRGPAVVFP